MSDDAGEFVRAALAGAALSVYAVSEGWVEAETFLALALLAFFVTFVPTVAYLVRDVVALIRLRWSR